ncbi:hypothetical protein ASZ90_001017 [hydrocarbon metagenome]|uniref:Uncharacterized protein n=1 Tax=hydrocarbon metagenome TaxID=938273 RepID=A0A0W8G7K6_9ZZZZ
MLRIRAGCRCRPFVRSKARTGRTTLHECCAISSQPVFHLQGKKTVFLTQVQFFLHKRCKPNNSQKL